MSNKQLVNIEDDKLSMEEAKRDRSGKRTLSIVKLFCNPLFSGNTKYKIPYHGGGTYGGYEREYTVVRP